MAFPTGCKDVVFQLRAQGMTYRAIAAELPTRFPGQHTPDHVVCYRWTCDPDAAALVQQATTRLRASYVNGAADVVPSMLEKIATAVDAGETGAARDLSQALAAVTRGIIADKVETSAPQVLDALDELGSLLARHGVKLTPAGNAAAPKDDAPSNDPST